jgi:serine/threonine-protein kinase HipA
MNGERVGAWSLPARGPQQFTYAESWLHSSQFRPLSLSLPAGLRASPLSGNAVESWFDNLLPDSDAIRRRAQARFQAASTSAFDLLAAIGRDPQTVAEPVLTGLQTSASQLQRELT